MSEISERQIKQAIGEAVIASQLFELTFVLVVRHAVEQQAATTFEQLIPFTDEKSLKQVVGSVLKRPGVAESLGELSDRVAAFISKRNFMVHRLAFEFMGMADTPDNRSSAYQFCLSVKGEADALLGEFHSRLVGWVERYPELKAIVDEARALYANRP